MAENIFEAVIPSKSMVGGDGGWRGMADGGEIKNPRIIAVMRGS